MKQYDVFSVRLQLLKNGYLPIPNHGKFPVLKGWNLSGYANKEILQNPKGTPSHMIKSWGWRLPYAVSTGGRLDDFGAADFDINDKAATEHLTDWLAREVPDVAARAPTRFGGGEYKMALFMRFTGEPFIRLGSRKYHKPDEPPERYHHVELFGGKETKEGKCSRQFALYGPRSYAADGSVETEYVWDESIPTLAEVPRADLPVMTRDQALALIETFETWAEANGWIVIQEDDDEGDGESSDVFDIDIETARFDIYRGTQGVTYEELKTELSISSDVRVSPSFMGVISDRLDRCSLFWSKRFPDCVVIKDWKGNFRHYPIQCKPTDMEDFGARIKQLVDKLGLEVLQPTSWLPNGAKPENGATPAQQLSWLLKNYGYNQYTFEVVDLSATSSTCTTQVRAFHTQFASWYDSIVGPRGGDKKIFISQLWLAHPNRIDIAGIRMRPDQPFPTYTEDGEIFKNTYRRPQHIGNGDVQPFLDFMERFLPDKREREWQLDYLAHKQAKPWVPGVSVIHVAADGRYGTGRGLFARTIHKLLGEAYTRAEDFDTIAGGSSQAVFNEWRANSILVTIDEAMTSPTAHRRGERRSVYEVLKGVADPAPKRYTFKGKYKSSFDGIAFSSIMVATNHANAIAISPDDRRFTVLNNGRTMLPEEAEAFAAWMADPGNIAELSRWLERRDISMFDPYCPLQTAAKTEMIEQSYSSVEDTINDFIEDDTRGLVFTRLQVEMEVENILSGGRGNVLSQHNHGVFDGAWNTYVKLLRTEGGAPCRIRIANGMGSREKRVKLYCFRANAEKAQLLSEQQQREHVNKWGRINLSDGKEKSAFTIIPGGLDLPKDVP
jgi:hypothetical protein